MCFLGFALGIEHTIRGADQIILMDVDDEISALEARLSKLKQQKETKLQTQLKHRKPHSSTVASVPQAQPQEKADQSKNNVYGTFFSLYLHFHRTWSLIYLCSQHSYINCVFRVASLLSSIRFQSHFQTRSLKQIYE